MSHTGPPHPLGQAVPCTGVSRMTPSSSERAALTSSKETSTESVAVSVSGGHRSNASSDAVRVQVGATGDRADLTAAKKPRHPSVAQCPADRGDVVAGVGEQAAPRPVQATSSAPAGPGRLPYAAASIDLSSASAVPTSRTCTCTGPADRHHVADHRSRPARCRRPRLHAPGSHRSCARRRTRPSPCRAGSRRTPAPALGSPATSDSSRVAAGTPASSSTVSPSAAVTVMTGPTGLAPWLTSAVLPGLAGPLADHHAHRTTDVHPAVDHQPGGPAPCRGRSRAHR